MTNKFITILATACAVVAAACVGLVHGEDGIPDDVIFIENGGLLVMEMESAPVNPDWVFEDGLAGFTGQGYYRMSGNTFSTGDPNGRTSFFFQINTAGRYRLSLRSYKNHEDSTWSNDCYTRMVGHPGYQGNDTKTYMFGPSFEWRWATTHQLEHDDQRTPFYDLAVGMHELQISGRSRGFHIDRVVLARSGSVSNFQATLTSRKESPRMSGSSPVMAIVDNDFSSSRGDFMYMDDTFRGTNNSEYARGWYGNQRLNIGLGGVDENMTGPISGGFVTSYTLSTPAAVRVEFRYRLNFMEALVDGESVEVLCSADGSELYGQAGKDYVDKYEFADNITAGLTDGWSHANVYLGDLSAGEHNVTIGGYLSMKNSTLDLIVYIDDVYITAIAAPTDMPTSAPTSAEPTAAPVPFDPVIMDDDFTTSTDGFVYMDDVFRGTSEPRFAWNWYSSNSNGRRLRVTLGGKTDVLVENMSGGYKKSFVLPADADLMVEFRYRVLSDSIFEVGEDVEVLCSVDGVLYGRNGNDYVNKFFGAGGAVIRSGWRTHTINLGSQVMGEHEFAVGGFLSSKNEAVEVAKIDIDDVYMTATRIVYPTSMPTTAPTSIPSTMEPTATPTTEAPTTPPITTYPTSPTTTVLDADFSVGNFGFVYMDDLFYGTSGSGTYAGGSHRLSQGRLLMSLGGKNDVPVDDMSGGFKATFVLSEPSVVRISILYRLTWTTALDDGDDAEFLCSINGITQSVMGSDKPILMLSGRDGTTADSYYNGNRRTNFQIGGTTPLEQEAGEYEIILGGYLTSKDEAAEKVSISIYSVSITAAPTGTTLAPTSSTATPTTSSPSLAPVTSHPTSSTIETLVDADFEFGNFGFIYQDDLFYGTSGSLRYASGSYQSGRSRLVVNLGGKDANPITAMSGGFKMTYTLSSPAIVRVSMLYRLEFPTTFEVGEDAQVLCAIDGVLISESGVGTPMLTLRGAEGDTDDSYYTGNRRTSFQLDGEQPAGDYEMTVGGYLSAKNEASESVVISFYELVITVAATG